MCINHVWNRGTGQAHWTGLCEGDWQKRCSWSQRVVPGDLQPSRPSSSFTMSTGSRSTLHIKLATLLGLEPALGGVAPNLKLTDKVVKEIKDAVVRTPARLSPLPKMSLTDPVSRSRSIFQRAMGKTETRAGEKHRVSVHLDLATRRGRVQFAAWCRDAHPCLQSPSVVSGPIRGLVHGLLLRALCVV